MRMRNRWLAMLAVMFTVGVSVGEAGHVRRSCRQRECCRVACPVTVPCCGAVATPTVVQVTRTATVVKDCGGPACRERTVTVTTGPASAFASTAQFKAQQLANMNRLMHLGGGFGSGSFEGIGTGSTAEQATQSCCYWGQRTPVEIGTAQSASGLWYAVVLYR